MNELIPSAQSWSGGDSFIERVESVLTAGRTSDIEKPLLWHHEALIRSHDIEPHDVLENSTHIVRAAPYDELLNHVDQVRYGNLDSLPSLRMGRRLFVIARDGIILTTRKHESEEFRSLRELCFSLGRIADTGGLDGTYTDWVASSLDRLRSAPHQADQHFEDTAMFQGKVATKLSSGILLGQPLHHSANQENYHQARKDFRRVCNLFILEAARSSDTAISTFAAQGVQLNRHYGNIADQLDSDALASGQHA